MGLGSIVVKNVITILPKSTAADAAMAMREAHVGDLVVADTRDGRSIPVGIITDRDIVMATAAFGVDPNQVNVADIMSTRLVTARATDSLTHVIDLMKKNAVKRIPIVGAHGGLEGIVTVEDVLCLLAEEFSALSKIPTEQRKSEQLRRRDFK